MLNQHQNYLNLSNVLFISDEYNVQKEQYRKKESVATIRYPFSWKNGSNTQQGGGNMTDVSGIAPKLSQTQIVNAIYGWTDYGETGVWTPGITFKGGSSFPQSPQNKDLFIKDGHLHQYQTGTGWVDLGATSGNLVPYGTSDPSPSQYGFINRLDQNIIKQWINQYSSWVSMGANDNGLPVGVASMKFTDDETGKAANLYLIINSYDNSPLLATDQGVVVKKDISAGGFLGSNQGVLYLGHGLNSDSEPPKIKLMHTSDMGWNPAYETLYLTKFNSTPANLDLGNLTVHGTSLFDSNALFSVDVAVSGTAKCNNDFVLDHATYPIHLHRTTRNVLGTTTGTMQVHDGGGMLATLDASNVCTDHLTSASGDGISVFDNLKLIGSAYISVNDDPANPSTGTLYIKGRDNSGTHVGHIYQYQDGNLVIDAPKSCLVDLGDTSGAYCLGIRDSAYALVAWINSDGNASLNGTLNINGQLQLPAQGSSGGLRIGGDVNLYRDSAYNLRLQNNLIVEQDLWCSDQYIDNTLGIGGNLTVKGAVPETALGYDNVRIGGPRIIFEDEGYTQWEIDNYQGNMRFFNPNVVRFQMSTTGFNPGAANTYGCGSGSYYWQGVVTNTIYRWYESSFDALDDLGLIKQYRTKKIVDNGIERDVIDIETLPHLKGDPKPNDPELSNFWDENKASGFLLGCVKSLVLRVEALENQLKGENA